MADVYALNSFVHSVTVEIFLKHFVVLIHLHAFGSKLQNNKKKITYCNDMSNDRLPDRVTYIFSCTDLSIFKKKIERITKQ